MRWVIFIKDTKGYTFIELVVVLMLMGLVFAIAMPRFRDAVVTDAFKSTARKMVGQLRALRNEAIRDHEEYVLIFDLESNRYWTESEYMTLENRENAKKEATTFPSGVSVADVWFKGKGKQTDGEVYLRFNKTGYVKQSVIHLASEDGRQFTLVLSPFLRKVRVLESYVEFEDI